MVARTTRRLLSRRYAVAWLYLGVYSLLAVIYAFLTSRDQAGLVAWSSTNLVNLRHNPAGSLLASAFVPGDPSIAWVVLGAAGLFTVNGLLGNVRTALLLLSGQVLGTLVSEGIVGYQVDHAMLPASARTIVDVGPSYIVVCALVVAILYGSRLQRVAAGASFAVLAPHIFRGITHLDVTAVGHLTAVTTGAVLGALLLRRAWADRAERAGLTARSGPGLTARSPHGRDLPLRGDGSHQITDPECHRHGGGQPIG